MEEKEPYSLLEKYVFYPNKLSENLYKGIIKHAGVCKKCKRKINEYKKLKERREANAI